MGEPVRAAPVFDAEMLTKKLPTGTSAGLDPTDPRLDEICGLVF